WRRWSWTSSTLSANQLTTGRVASLRRGGSPPSCTIQRDPVYHPWVVRSAHYVPGCSGAPLPMPGAFRSHISTDRLRTATPNWRLYALACRRPTRSVSYVARHTAPCSQCADWLFDARRIRGGSCACRTPCVAVTPNG